MKVVFHSQNVNYLNDIFIEFSDKEYLKFKRISNESVTFES